MTEVIRIAQRSEEDHIMMLCTMMHAEGGFMPIDYDEVSAMLHRAFQREGGILGVIGEPNDIKAMIFLLISKMWYTKQLHLEELFNFVRPDVRASSQKYGLQLIEFAKRCSNEIGLPLTIGVLT